MPPGNAPEHLPKFTVSPAINGFATDFMHPMNQISCFRSAKQMAKPPKTRHGPQSNKNRPPFNAKIKNVQSMHYPCQIARKGRLCSILPHS